MANLSVKCFKQEMGSSCGLACLRMVFDYLGDSVTEKELAKDIKIHSYGTHETDLGLVALKRGFRVTSYVFHLNLFGPLKLPFGTKITTKHLKSIKLAPKDKNTYESISKFIKSGGSVIWDTPKISTIESSLDKKNPCIVSINTSALNDFWRNWDNGHYLTVIGSEKDKFTVLDPSIFAKPQYSIEKDIFLPAWAINSKLGSGYLLVIEK